MRKNESREDYEIRRFVVLCYIGIAVMLGVTCTFAAIHNDNPLYWIIVIICLLFLGFAFWCNVPKEY